MEFLIKLTEEEEILVRKYAAMRGVSIEKAFKEALFEKIEEEHDIAVYGAAYRRYLDNPKTYSHAEILKIFCDED